MAENIFNPDDIQIGAGNLSLKFKGEANPTFVGLSRDFNLESQPKLLNILADQSLDPVKQVIIGRDTKGTIVLLEMSMRNLVIALGGDPNDVVEDIENNKLTYTIKSNLVAPPEAELIYKVPRPMDETKYITITLLKIQSSGGLKLQFVKDKENAFTFSFVALPKEVDNVMTLGTLEIDGYAAPAVPEPGA